jgi:hypothetical protein
MSGLSRTPGKRVWDNIPTGVRIPPSPPDQKGHSQGCPFSHLGDENPQVRPAGSARAGRTKCGPEHSEG